MQALLSVFDKRGTVDFARSLVEIGFSVISTGGTAKTLQTEGIPVVQVSEVTHFPEVLEGRVKTLHPNIHAALLARSDVPSHVEELKNHSISPIQLVAVNLYAFEQTIAKQGVTVMEALEMIDIGGVTLLRAAAKNFAHVLVIVDPSDYTWVASRLKSHGLSGITLTERKQLAAKAFQHVCSYDAVIAQYLTSLDIEKSETVSTLTTTSTLPPTTVRPYEHQFELKYGVNPHQNPSGIYNIKGVPLPFQILNGTPGYINLLDALNAWQLVRELKDATGLTAAASFKHVSPAGAAISVPLTDSEKEVYEIGNRVLTPAATAYIRARNADPMCSFGDFAALSDIVDEVTASVLKTEVSDGIIAPGFDEKALEILRQKKGGKYIIISINPEFEAPDVEWREVFGIVFAQKRNNLKLSKDAFKEIITRNKDLSEEGLRDLLVATITLKYTQSNSVGYCIRGQMIGVGAGQQSRVDCTKLAGSKVRTWYLRFHPSVRALPFKDDVKRVDKVNARVHFIDNNLTDDDLALFENQPVYLSEQEKHEWMSSLTNVSLSSDAFFPFRDSIDVCSHYGVKYVAQPGGSVQDETVISACNQYDMVMVGTGIRLFHH